MSFLASLIRCEICTKEWGSVYPESAAEESLECPSCGAQDSCVLERWAPGGRRIVVEDVENWQ